MGKASRPPYRGKPCDTVHKIETRKPPKGMRWSGAMVAGVWVLRVRGKQKGLVVREGVHDFAMFVYNGWHWFRQVRIAPDCDTAMEWVERLLK